MLLTRPVKLWAVWLLKLARRLRGKHKAEYTPHVDTGDYIIVLNADKVAVTGNKRTDKVYYHHTGHIGGIKQATFEEMIARRPERVIEIAVKGMLPKGPLVVLCSVN